MSDTSLTLSDILTFKGLPSLSEFESLTREERTIILILMEYREMTVLELVRKLADYQSDAEEVADDDHLEYCIDFIENSGYALIDGVFVAYKEV